VSWAPAYCTADDVANWIGDDAEANAAEFLLSIESASRAIDQKTNRQFGQVAAPEARYYTAKYHRDLCRWVIDTDDLMTITGLVVAVDDDGDGTYSDVITAYDLTPINAAPIGRPWTRVEVKNNSAITPRGRHNGVKVTARYGWSAVPEAIQLGTMIQAARLFARRDASVGALSSKQVDDVQYQWQGVPDGLDADVAVSVAPYVKWWAAA
jgi:hypothetical protein